MREHIANMYFTQKDPHGTESLFKDSWSIFWAHLPTFKFCNSQRRRQRIVSNILIASLLGS